MAKDPAFLFYPQDFLTGTFTMSNEQVGKYIRLLCLQHQKGALTENDMMVICSAYDEDIFSKFVKVNGTYINERLNEEATKRKAYSESRRSNKTKKQTHQHMMDISSTHLQHMENENENENEDEDDIVLLFQSNELCEMWNKWKEYKHQQFRFKYKSKQSIKTSLSNLHKLSNGKTHIAIDIINQSIANGWKGFFEI